MGQRAAAPHGVMESGGSYNLHSAIPAGGAGLALPLLEQVARTIALDSTDQPLVIADYGSSQGKNSSAPASGHQDIARSCWPRSAYHRRAR